MRNQNNRATGRSDFLGFVQEAHYTTRTEWYKAMDCAADDAERDRKNHRRSKQPYLRDRADDALIFLEKLRAALFWLHHCDYPHTSHNDVGAAIKHIQQCLSL